MIIKKFKKYIIYKVMFDQEKKKKESWQYEERKNNIVTSKTKDTNS